MNSTGGATLSTAAGEELIVEDVRGGGVDDTKLITLARVGVVWG
ncbi:MAG: hypothetical protein ACXW3C_04255 [Pyrinomonadaceae bacterium]